MIDSYLRSSVQSSMIDPIITKTPLSKVHPIVITCLGLVMGLVGSVCIYMNLPGGALFLIFLSGLFDVLDGSAARLRNLTSDLGASLDLIFDRVIEMSIIIALFSLDPIGRGLPCLMMLGSVYLCVASFFIVSMFSDQKSEKSFYYSPGLIERTEAFLFFGFLVWLPEKFVVGSILFVGLVLCTSVLRMVQFGIQEVRSKKESKQTSV